MSGWDVLIELKEKQRNQNSFMSVLDISDKRRQVLIEGLADYIMKPLIRKLLQKVDKILNSPKLPLGLFL